MPQFHSVVANHLVDTNDLAKPDIESFAKPFFSLSVSSTSDILYVSPSIREVLGHNVVDVVGRRCDEIVTAIDPTDCNGLTDDPTCLSLDENRTCLGFATTTNGERRVLAIHWFPQKSDSISGGLPVCHVLAEDITHRYKMDIEVSDRFAELKATLDNLSERERDVLERVMDGQLNKSIAKQLAVSERTVESARSRLMTKFGAQTTAHLVRKATEYNMLSQFLRLQPGEECARV